MKRLLSDTKKYYLILLYFSDILMLFISFILAYMFFYPENCTKVLLADTRFQIFTLLILLINYTFNGLYKNKRTLFDDSEVMRIAGSLLTTYAIVIITSLLFNIHDILLYLVITLAFLIASVLTIASRLMLSKVVFHFRKKGYDQKRVIFYGKADDFMEKVKENPYLGYRIVAKTGSLNELKHFLKKTDIVFIAKETMTEELLTVIIENPDVHWKIISDALNLVIDPVDFDEFKDYPIINVTESKYDSKYVIIKRLMDIMLSGATIIILSPLLILIAVIIKATSPGPVFFRQERLGKDLRPFSVYKFRTMKKDSDRQKDNLNNEVKGLFKMKDDPRVTGIGKMLRRSCLDEIPQIFNIFFGDMSVVGPRPHLRRELSHFKGWRMARFKLKPGLTGMWQVNGRHELNFDKAVLYDIYYIKNMSFFLDLAIILKTIPAIVFSKGRF